MKTFSIGHNPENLTLAPGYRWLRKNESLRFTDEIYVRNDQKWIALGEAMKASRCARWSYRRALNVEDPYAPPPEEFCKPGYEIRSGNGLTVQPGDEFWMNPQKWPNSGWNGDHTKDTHFDESWARYVYVRRPIVQSNTQQPSNLPNPMSPMPKSLIIHVGNPSLSRAVQTILFEAGWKWCTSGMTICELDAQALHLEHKTIMFSSSEYARSKYPARIHLDARTDMGKIVDWLEEAKRPPAPKAPRVNGYDGAYVKGGDVIRFGCAELSISVLTNVAKAMGFVMPDDGIMENAGQVIHGNRSIKSVTLSSDVTLLRSDVQAIMRYVRDVNKGA